METTIWRIGQCKAQAGYKSDASIYGLIREGLWTKPIAIGTRSTGWPASEVQTLCAARIAGMDEAGIKKLVCKLHEKRLELLPTV